jgi:hypothetical protein
VKFPSKSKETQIQLYSPNIATQDNRERNELIERGDDESAAVDCMAWRREASARNMRGFVDEDFIIRPMLRIEVERSDTGFGKNLTHREPWVDADRDVFFECLENYTLAEDEPKRAVCLEIPYQKLDNHISEEYYDSFEDTIDLSPDLQKLLVSPSFPETCEGFSPEVSHESIMAYDGFIETITPIPESPCASDSVISAPKVQILNAIENDEQVADEQRHPALSTDVAKGKNLNGFGSDDQVSDKPRHPTLPKDVECNVCSEQEGAVQGTAPPTAFENILAPLSPTNLSHVDYVSHEESREDDTLNAMDQSLSTTAIHNVDSTVTVDPSCSAGKRGTIPHNKLGVSEDTEDHLGGGIDPGSWHVLETASALARHSRKSDTPPQWWKEGARERKSSIFFGRQSSRADIFYFGSLSAVANQEFTKQRNASITI